MDGTIFGASTHPLLTAVADYIIRAQAYVNEIGPDITQALHDEAVMQICIDFVRIYNQTYLSAGAAGASGEKGASYNWSPADLLSNKLRADINRSQRKVHCRVRIGTLISQY